MQNLTSTLGRLAVVLTSALALSSCNRAEYAFLPKSASYLGTTTTAPKARVAATVATPAPVAQAPAAAPATEAPAVAPEIEIAAAPAAPRAAKVEAPTPSVQAEVAAATVAAPAPQKLNLVQRLALAKVTKKLNKLAAKSPQFKQGDNTAHTARIDGNLRYAIIFGVLSLIFFAIGGGFLNTVGVILLIIGLIFLLLWVLDAL